MEGGRRALTWRMKEIYGAAKVRDPRRRREQWDRGGVAGAYEDKVDGRHECLQ